MLSQTIDVLDKYDNQHDFERMAADILNEEGNRDVTPIAPRGGSDKGKDITYTKNDGSKGLACATIGYKDDISTKFYLDFSQRKLGEYQEYVFFCTACVSSSKKEEFRNYVSEKLGAKLVIRDIEALRSLLDTTRYQYIRKHWLGIDVDRHNWTSLLAACQDHQRKTLARYNDKYDPSLYVQRDTEQKIHAWYRQATISIRHRQHQETENHQALTQLLAVVDQAGSGKTNVVLHLAEEYGRGAPVIMIPGNRTITDEHTLEREIIYTVGYAVDGVIRAKINELCQIAEHEGYPLLVIIEGVDENRDLIRMRQAIEELLTTYQDHPLLLLVTCRDTIWSSLRSPTIKRFMSERGDISLGLYNDEEFEQARKKYFARWNVHAELSIEAKKDLRSPLLFSIFAEVNQGCSSKFVPTIVAKDLWKKYFEKKIDAIHEALEMSRSKRAIRTAIEQVALGMLERNSSALSLSDISDLNHHIDPDDTSTRSLFLQLKNSGVLFEDISERISFVYETFFEYVAGQALARAFENPMEREGTLKRIEELSRTYRWRQVPLYLTELVSEPDAIIERLRLSNIWLAAQALRRTSSHGSLQVQQQLIADLEEKLKSKFSLDRQRAADLLGLLKASESKDQLLHCWATCKPNSYEAQAVLRALARLGVEDIVEPFIRYLGRYLEWYFPEDQELVDMLPAHFRQQLSHKTLALLQDPEYMYAAAHTIGCLKAEQAVTALRFHLEATEWSSWVALLALVHIATEEAFNALEVALSEIGERISASNQQSSNTKDPTDAQKEARRIRDELVMNLSVVRVDGFYHCSLHVIIPFLVRLLEHPNIYVRHEAIQSLGELGASETALAIIKSRPADDQRPGFGIIETLTAFGTHVDIEPMLAIVNDPTSPELVVRDAIKALGVSRDRRVLEPLSAFITQRRYLFETIQALGDTRLPEAVPPLVQVLKDNAADSTNSDGFSRDMLDDLAISNLGELQHPDAFEPIEHYARKHLPEVGHQTIGALTASGGERAIPLLQEMWGYDPDKRKAILRALLWIETITATNKIIELLQPIDGKKAVLLANALSNGRGLDFITGTALHVGILETVDNRLVAILDAHFDEMNFDGKWRAVIAMKYIGTLVARQMLERIANDPKYDEILFPNAGPGSFRTIREAAIHMLYDLGSPIVIDAMLDTLLDQPAHIIEFRLRAMDYTSVKDALQRRLNSAEGQLLIRLLTLLGIFGDYTVLPALQPYINDSKPEVADAAYTAEQQILGLAYF